jgi:hypothetical protein
MLGNHSPISPGITPEVGYCKIKVFRDHGAERKHAHDIDHVKKAIGKVNQRIIRAEASEQSSKGKKRTSYRSQSGTGSAPDKTPRSRLSTSYGLISNKALSAKELRLSLASLQSMMTATRVHSVLSLTGDDLDIPCSEHARLEGDRSLSIDFDIPDDLDPPKNEMPFAILPPLNTQIIYSDDSQASDENGNPIITTAYYEYLHRI